MGYVNTRPLYNKISNKPYSNTMQNKIKKLGIKDYEIKEKKSARNTNKIIFHMSLADWNKIKEDLKA